jgi:GDPmannose 4,6-dehydratase
MWSMLQLDTPQDFVIATEETHTVREFARLAFQAAGLDWQDHVVIDPRFVRPAEVNQLIGDCSAARRAFGWKPRVLLPQLVEMMVQADLERLGR